MRSFLPAASKLLSFGCFAALLSGCGISMPSVGDGGIFSSSKKPENSWTPIITEDSMLAAARTNSDGPVEMAAANGCPPCRLRAVNVM